MDAGGSGGQTAPEVHHGVGAPRPPALVVRLAAEPRQGVPDAHVAGEEHVWVAQRAASKAVDPGKLHRMTGWEAQVDLDEGLARTIAWYREHRALVV